MKKFKMILVLFLFIPFIVNAEIRDYSLSVQTNSGVYNAYNHSNIYQLDDLYFIDGYVEEGAVDFNGKILYTEKLRESSFATTDGTYIYYVDSYNNLTTIYKVNPQTGDKQSYEIPCKQSYCYTYLNVYANDKGIVYIVSENRENIYYLVNYDLTSHKVVDASYAYNTFDESKDYIVSEEISQKVLAYLLDNNIKVKETSEVVEYNNQYFVIVKSDLDVKLFYFNKDISKHNYISISNSLNASYIDEVELFVQEDGVVAWVMSGVKLCQMSNIQYDRCGYAYIMNKFIPLYNIVEKTDGNGIIDISKVQANEGEEIEFTIKPNAGYVLNEVKVTDSFGNAIIITDNKFTMPSKDVTIEATFIKEVKNAETSTSSTIIFISLLASIFLVLSIYRWCKILK